MLAVTANAVKAAVMAAVAGAMVAVASAANLPQEKPAHPAKAVAEAKVELKAVKAKPGRHVLNVQNAASALSVVSALRERDAAMADPKYVAKVGARVEAKGAPIHAQKPEPMHQQS
jgi:hypothetical protein